MSLTLATLTPDREDYGGDATFMEKVSQARGVQDFRTLFRTEALRQIHRDLLSGRGWDVQGSEGDASTVDGLVDSFSLLWKCLMAEAQLVVLYTEESGEEGSVNYRQYHAHAKGYRNALDTVLRLNATQTSLARTRSSSFPFRL